MENLFRLVDHDDFVARRCIMINGAVIVGASPSGLALMAAYLRDQGVPFVVLERADCIASLWQKRTYDRLKLHLPKAFCQLPKLPFPEDFPEYPTQRQFIHYLESYAKHFEINPKFNSCVQSARYDETIGFWRVNTVSTTGSTRSEVECICRWLIATTGENAVCEHVRKITQSLVSQLLQELRLDFEKPEAEHCLRIVGYLRRTGVYSEYELRLQFLKCRQAWLTGMLEDLDEGNPDEYFKGMIGFHRKHLVGYC